MRSVLRAAHSNISWRTLLPLTGLLLGGGCDTHLGPALELSRASIAAAPPVVLSQIYGGGGNSSAPFLNDYVELFNKSAAPVVLDGWSVQYTSATGTGFFSGAVTLLTGTLQPGHYYLVKMGGGATGAPLPTPDATGTTALSASAGKVVLVSSATGLACNGASTPCGATDDAKILDLVGYGNANYFDGAPAPTLGNTTAALRGGFGCNATHNNGADFSAGAPTPRNTSSPAQNCSGGGDAAPFVASTAPADGASGVSPAVAVTVTFSEAVTVSGSWFTFTCATGGTIGATVSGGPTVYVLTPPAPLPAGDSCQIHIVAAAVTDVDALDPPDQMLADKTISFVVAAGSTSVSVHDVQGAAHRSPVEGQLLTVGPAVVTALDSNGFYMQEPAPDSSDATSEGVFVFTSTAPNVLVGDSVTVRGTVSEFRAGCPSPCTSSSSGFENLTQTEIVSPSVTVLAHGQALPPPVILGTGAGERRPPNAIIEDDVSGDVELTGTFDPANDGIDFFESLEGMRVRIDNAVAVSPTKTFTGGSLELGVLARGGTDAVLRTARGGVLISASNFNPERLILSNGLGVALPTLNLGDSFAGNIVGVVTYSFANFKVDVSDPLPPVVSAGLAREITPLVATSPTHLTMATLNVENLDPTDPASKFSRLASIVVDNLRSPDLLSVEEVQDNDGATSGVVVACDVTMQTFIDAIVAAGGPRYDYRQIDPENNQDGGEPGGNIRVVLMFRTGGALALVSQPGANATTPNAVTGVAGAPHLAFSPGRLDPANPAFLDSRKPLAAEFTFGTKRLFVVGNHLVSKGGDQSLYGRFQPPTLGSNNKRVSQAQVVASFVQQLTALDPQANIVVLGDLNDFEFSPPLMVLKQAGLTALVETLPANERYSYVYDANSQTLDHILVSPALAPRSSYDIVHVNAEFADQASDHDTAIVRFDFGTAPVFTSTPPASVAVGATFNYQLVASGTPSPTFALVSGPPGMSLNVASGLITWTANVAPGPQSVTVRAQNGVAPEALQTFTFSVSAIVTVSAPALPNVTLCLLVASMALLGVRLLGSPLRRSA